MATTNSHEIKTVSFAARLENFVKLDKVFKTHLDAALTDLR